MAYTERDWANTGTKVTKEDFERMETGIKDNDNAITEQAQKIEENTNQINVLYCATELPLATDILVTAKDISVVPLGARRVLRIFNSSTSPYSKGDDDFIYEVYRTTDENFLTINAYDVRSYKEFRNKLLNGVWGGWQEIATTEMTYGVRLFSGSITAVNGTLQLSDSLLNYKELIINFGNVAAGKNQALSFKSYNYPGNIRSTSEEMFMPILVGGVWYRLYIKPDTDTTKLYYELRNLDESVVTSNPATSYFCIRYVVGVK